MKSARGASRSPSRDKVRGEPKDNVIPLRSDAATPVDAADESALDLTVDGRRVVVEAKRELVLRCGKASITLTRAGKIILRGTHVVSRSSGTNRVLGTQVRIN